MKLAEVLTVLDAEKIGGRVDLRAEFSRGAAADLMSDVLTYARPDSVLLTGLIYPQVVRTAEMAGLQAIVFVRGKRPPAETVSLAKEVGIPLFSTRYTMYEACGLLYQAGLPGPGLCETFDQPGQAEE